MAQLSREEFLRAIDDLKEFIGFRLDAVEETQDKFDSRLTSLEANTADAKSARAVGAKWGSALGAIVVAAGDFLWRKFGGPQ